MRGGWGWLLVMYNATDDVKGLKNGKGCIMIANISLNK